MSFVFSFKLQFLPEHSSYFVIGINGVTDQLPNVWDFSSSINPTNTGLLLHTLLIKHQDKQR